GGGHHAAQGVVWWCGGPAAASWQVRLANKKENSGQGAQQNSLGSHPVFPKLINGFLAENRQPFFPLRNPFRRPKSLIAAQHIAASPHRLVAKLLTPSVPGRTGIRPPRIRITGPHCPTWRP